MSNIKANDVKDNIMKKSVLATVLALALPSIIEQLLTTIMHYADTAMVGHYSTAASAATGLSTTINWLINGPISAVGVGILVIISAAVGSGNPDKISRAFNQAHLLVLIIGIAEGIIALACAPFMPMWMNADPEIYHDGSWYFAIICMPMIARAAMIIYAMSLRALGDVKTPMIINLSANILNVILNAFLIFPQKTVKIFDYEFVFKGAGLGAIGAGIATAVSTTLAGTILFIIVTRRFKLTRSALKFDKPILRECIRIALPLSFSKVVTCFGFVVAASIVSSLGTTIFAANSLATTAETLFYIPGFGMQTAASTLAGYARGKRDKALYKKFVFITILIVVLIMCVSTALLLLFSTEIMSIFSKDPEVIKMSASALRIVAIAEPCFGAFTVMLGLIGGLGYTKPEFIIEGGSMWLVRILSLSICVNYFNPTLDTVWYCMIADIFFKFAVIVLFMTFGKCFDKACKRDEEYSNGM